MQRLLGNPGEKPLAVVNRNLQAVAWFSSFAGKNPDELLQCTREWVCHALEEFSKSCFKDSRAGRSYVRSYLSPFFESNKFDLPASFQTTKTFLRIKVAGRSWHSALPSVQTWLDSLETRKSNSGSTKRTHTERLHEFSILTGLGPEDLVKCEKRWLQKKLEEFGMEVVRRTGWAKTANIAMAGVKSFFTANGFRAEDGRELVVNHMRESEESKRPEYDPKVPEVLKMARACGVGTRNYCIILMLAFSGLRNSALRALRAGDIQSQLADGQDILALRIKESMNDFIDGACKGGRRYTTFTPKMTTVGLTEYLRSRKDKQGELADEEVLFPTLHTGIPDPKVRARTPMTKEALRALVREAARKAGIAEWRAVHPHCFRKTFESWLRNQPPESRLDYKEIETLLGHKLPAVQRAYFRPPEEELREKFSRLEVEPNVATQTVRLIAKRLGIDHEMARQVLRSELGRDPTPTEEKENLMGLIPAMREEREVPTSVSSPRGQRTRQQVRCPRNCGCHLNPPPVRRGDQSVFQCPLCGCFHGPDDESSSQAPAPPGPPPSSPPPSATLPALPVG